jgi:hypothetical protein
MGLRQTNPLREAGGQKSERIDTIVKDVKFFADDYEKW